MTENFEETVFNAADEIVSRPGRFGMKLLIGIIVGSAVAVAVTKDLVNVVKSAKRRSGD